MPPKSQLHFEIVPLVGIGPVRLGAAREEVRGSMREHGGLRSESGNLDYFLGNALQVEYTAGRASFIGVSSFCPGYSFSYCGVDPFDTPAEVLFALIAKHESASHAFNADDYVFPDQIVTLYEADEQYDYAGDHMRAVYGQVGLGNEAYLAASKPGRAA